MKRTFPAISFFLLLLANAGHAASSEAERAQARARELRLAESPEWRALLHLQRNILFQRRSAIDDPSFFLSPRGQKDPVAELDATIAAFADEAVIEGEPAACRYPARYAWLAPHLEFSSAPACGRFDEWKRKLAPAGVSLIFSAYYLNNPASMYGHTFLKLTRAGYEASGALLDYTVNYAATTNTNNGVLFAARGLMGGYKGRFSTEPYYIKIQQYNNMESRDIWEYRLNLDQAAVDRLVMHLWELGGTAMTYYFFNKNCSYQILPLLEVADPSLDVASVFRFRAIPLDTLRAVLDHPGFVTEAKLRPSHLRKMLARRDLLNQDELKLAETLSVRASSETVAAVEAMPVKRRALILDSAYDLFRYRSGFYRNQPVDVQARERRLLELRRGIPAADGAETPLTYDVPGPHLGHNTGRVGLFAGGDRRRRFQEANIRASIHDLEANPTGYVQGSQLEMFNVRLRYQEPFGVFLEEFRVFEIISLSPWDRWVHSPSWMVRANVAVARDLNRRPESSLLSGLDGGSGFAYSFVPGKKLIAYAQWKLDLEAGHALPAGFRAGFGANAGVLATLCDRARLHVSATATRFGWGTESNRVELKAVQSLEFTRNLEGRISLLRVDDHREAMAGLNLYW